MGIFPRPWCSQEPRPTLKYVPIDGDSILDDGWSITLSYSSGECAPAFFPNEYIHVHPQPRYVMEVVVSYNIVYLALHFQLGRTFLRSIPSASLKWMPKEDSPEGHKVLAG